MKDSNIFICYSIPLKNRFDECGIRYNVVGLNPNPPHNRFYVYEKTDMLNCVLVEWAKDKNVQKV